MVADGELTRQRAKELRDEICPHMPDGTSVSDWIAQHPEATYADMCSVFGVSRERVRQIEWRAMRDLNDGKDPEGLGWDAIRANDSYITSRLLEILEYEPMTSVQLAEAVGSTQDTVLRLLRILQAANKVRHTKHGRGMAWVPSE